MNDAEILHPVQWLNALASTELNNDVEIRHFVERDSNLLNPTTMQKFCTLLNETQIYWTQQRCRNSALYWTRLKSAEPNNDAEILHFVERDSNLLNPKTMQKFCTLSDEAQIYWTQQRSIV